MIGLRTGRTSSWRDRSSTPRVVGPPLGSLRGRILGYLEFVRARGGNAENSGLLAGSLSAQLQTELRLFLYFSPIARAEFFHASTPDVVVRLVRMMQDRTFSPGDYVMRKGEAGTTMFFVLHGCALGQVRREVLRALGRQGDLRARQGELVVDGAASFEERRARMATVGRITPRVGRVEHLP